MGTHRRKLAALAIIGLTAAGCGARTPSAPAGAVTSTPGLTAYQRAYPPVCESATTAPPTDAPGSAAEIRPLWYRLAWARGFCSGEVAVRIWAGQPQAGRDAVAAGNAARLALVAVPPRCAEVVGTPAGPYCP